MFRLIFLPQALFMILLVVRWIFSLP